MLTIVLKHDQSKNIDQIQGTLAELMAFVKQIPTLFMDTLHSLEWTDILNLPQGFRKVAVPFGTFLGRFISWAGDKVWTLLQLIFEVVAPAVMPYLKKVGASFKKILKDPIGFMRHLIAAGKLGFTLRVATPAALPLP